MRTRWAAAIVLGALLGCRTPCCDLVGPAGYTWRGQTVDSATGLPLDDIQMSVRERAQHDSLGWMPGGLPEFSPNGHFAFTYVLANFSWCDGAHPDTTLTLHVDFTDPQGRVSPSTHVSFYTTHCRSAPGAPAEDTGLVIRMAP